MDPLDKFEFIFEIGKVICSHYTGFSISEIVYCQQKSNWLHLEQFLLSNDPYEALINFSLHPIVDVVGYFQLFIGCMIDFPNEEKNLRMSNLLEIIDTQDVLDEALTNSSMMRALLAVNARYVKSSPDKCYNLFYNCKRILAHIFKKYPKYFDLNILKTNKKSKKLRFNKEEVDLFW